MDTAMDTTLDSAAFAPAGPSDVVRRTPPVASAAPPKPPAPRKEAAAPTDAAPPAEGGEEGKAARSRGLASGGRTADIPPMPPAPAWDQAAGPNDDYLPAETADYTDLSQVNLDINRARRRLFQVSAALRIASREAIEAEVTYRRHMRRALVSLSGGSAEGRKAMAEMQCEEYENAMVVTAQVVEELKKRSTDARDDLKAAENIAHNVRAQMDVR
jgi:hypothetical protein